ncbi:MAG: cytochrome P450 [Caldilineaceae bacterium]
MLSSISKSSTLVNPIDSAATMPEERGLPLLGALPHLLSNPFRFLEQAFQRHGDLYALNLGFVKLVILNHPRHAQHILRDHAQNYYKGGALWQAVRPLTGNGLVSSEGDFWLRQRRMMQPQFHRQRLAGLTHLMIEGIQEALNSWDQQADGKTSINLAQNLNGLTMRVVVKTLFGTALSPQEIDQVGEDMGFALDYVMIEALAKSLPQWFPMPNRKKFKQAIARFDHLVYRIIEQGRRVQAEQQESDNHLLAMLLNTVDEETGEGMSDQQLRDEVATLFLAGYETTSVALSWAFHYLTGQPEVMATLQNEVQSAFGGRTPGFADLTNLPYTRMVLQEVMRLRPPSYWLPRTAKEEDTIDGYTIPAGTHVASFTYMYHRHPEFWPNSEHFDPQRFSPEQSAGRHHFAWIPFGAGQRLCIGRDFALMEGTLALAMIIQRYQVKAIEGHQPKLTLTTTLRPTGGVNVMLEKR